MRSTDNSATSLWVYPGVLALLFLVIFSFIFFYPERINDNSALLLQAGTLLWNGETPYVDFIELDPPLIFYLLAIPVAIASFLSVNKILVFSLCVASLALYSVLKSVKTLKDSALNISYNQIYTFSIFFTFLILWVLARDLWGERDFLFILALVPFLVLRFVRSENGNVSKANALQIGLICGIFSILKHYFLLIILLNELLILFRRRSLRVVGTIEIFSMITVFIVYALHFILIPEIGRVYFNQWVPMLLQHYVQWDSSYLKIFDGYKYYLVYFSLVGGLTALLYKKSTTTISQFLPSLIISLSGALAIFFIQQKGFLYQLIPALGISSLIIGIGYIELMPHLSQVRRVLVSSSLALCCLFCVIYMFAIPQIRTENKSPIKEAISKFTKRDDPVLILSSTVYDTYPVLVQMQRKPGSRYLTTFPFSFLPKIIDYSDPNAYPSYNQLSKDEKEFMQVLFADIKMNHPRLLLVKNTNSCQGCPKDFNIFDYLTKIDFFSQISKDYRRQEDIKDFAVYTYEPGGKSQF